MRHLAAALSLLLGVVVSHNAWADAPTVTLTFPRPNEVIDQAATPTVLLQATATDADEAILDVVFGVCQDPCSTWTYMDGGETPPFQVRWALPQPNGLQPNGSVTIPYQVSVLAQNVLGVTRQTIVPITVLQPPMPYSTKLIIPNHEYRFVAPASPVFYATAVNNTAPPSTLDRMDFLDGVTVIGTMTTPNAAAGGYAFVWQNAPAGIHLITVRATNSLGYSAATAPTQISIVPSRPPSAVSLTTPTTGQIYTSAGPIPFAASTTGPQGSIQRMEFVAGSTVVATSFGAPYSASWINPPAGDITVVARAFDDRGVSFVSPAAYIRVLAAPRPPSVILTAPNPGSTAAASAPLTLSADALAPDGAIGHVDFYGGATLLGTAATSPYQFSWANPTVGSISLTAKAYDLQGATGTSAPAPIVVTIGTPPTVLLTAPANNSTFSAPGTIAVSATAAATGASIAKVEFFANATLIATQTASPFNVSWSNVAAGSYSLTAKVTDTLGGTAVSTPISVTVTTNQPPLVTMTAPTNGQTFSSGQSITLSATASDPDGTVTKVEFLADGAVVGSVTSAPFTITWSNAAAGAHTLAARATDNQSATTTSTTLSITVSATSATTVALILPRTGSAFATGATINLAATAASSTGTITRVDFYVDGALIATAAAAPYNAIWSNATAGMHVLTAKAVDDHGAATTSASVTVQVITPALTITTPANGVSVAADFVLVVGTYQGPPNSGVTVNGVVAKNDGLGHYFVNNLPLTDGSNTLTVVLTTPDGQSSTETQMLTRTGVAPMQVYADPDEDFAPVTFTIRVTNRTMNTITNVSYQNLAGGQLDASTVDQTTLGEITYATPGIYMPGFVITDSAGNTYNQTVALLAQDKVALDQMLKAVWGGFAGALASGNRVTAMQKLSDQGQTKYGPVFAALDSHLTDILATWSAPTTGLLATEMVEFGINRTLDGVNSLFLVYLLRDRNGVWIIESM